MKLILTMNEDTEHWKAGDRLEAYEAKEDELGGGWTFLAYKRSEDVFVNIHYIDGTITEDQVYDFEVEQ